MKRFKVVLLIAGLIASSFVFATNANAERIPGMENFRLGAESAHKFSPTSPQRARDLTGGTNELDEVTMSYLGSVNLPSTPTSILDVGTRIYAVCGDDGLQILDFSNPGSATIASVYDPGASFSLNAVAESNQAVYLATNLGLYTLDMSDVTVPAPQTFYGGPEVEPPYYGVTVGSGGEVYVTAANNILVFETDTNGLLSPTYSSSFAIGAAEPGQIEYHENHLYVNLGTAGIGVYSLDGNGDVSAHLSTISTGNINVTNFSLSEHHIEYVDANLNALYDVTDPSNPVQKFSINGNSNGGGWAAYGGVDLDGKVEGFSYRVDYYGDGTEVYDVFAVSYYPLLNYGSSDRTLLGEAYDIAEGENYPDAVRVRGNRLYGMQGTTVSVYDISGALSLVREIAVDDVDLSAFPEVKLTLSIDHLDGTPVTDENSSNLLIGYGEAAFNLTSLTLLEDNRYEATYNAPHLADGQNHQFGIVVYVNEQYYGYTRSEYTSPDPYTVSLDDLDISAFPEITVAVSVVDGEEAIVSGLTADNFTLLEANTEQTLTSVTDNGASGYEIVYTSTDIESEGVRTVKVTAYDGVGVGSDQQDYTASSITSLSLAIGSIDASLFPEVRSFVSVTDQNDELISEFTASNFTVSEDDADQSLLSVTELGAGVVATGFGVNFAPSMDEDELADQHQAFTNYINAFTAGDSGFATQYGSNVGMNQNLTDNQSVLLGAIELMSALNRNGRVVWDAALNTASAVYNAAHYKVGLIVVDGPDTGSFNSFDDAVTYINSVGNHMYVVGLGKDVDADSLQMLADQTGGFYFHAKTSSELPGLFTKIAAAVHSNYALSYNTSNDLADGSTRNVDIEASLGSLTDLDTRSYTAPLQYGVTIPSVDASAFPDVSVMVNVVDHNDDPLAGLTLADFTLWEDEVGHDLASVTEQETGSYELVYTTLNTTEDGSDRHVLVQVGEGFGLDDIHYTSHLFTPTLTITSKNAILNQVVEVPVIAQDLENVSVIELYVDYDQTKLTYSDLVPDGLSGAVFNDNNGTVILSWFSTTPVAPADGDTLFTLKFLVDGLANAETTDLVWGDASYIADYDANLFHNAVYNDGLLTGINTAAISGRLSYFTSDISLGGATVHLGGDTTLTTTSDENGEFLFEEIRPGDYVMYPDMVEEGHQGVNTLDAYRIQVSLDDINPFATGYEYYASDVDLSQVVNTLDAYNIQRRVVGLIDGFAASDWAFINSSYGMTTENWAEAELLRSFDLMGVDSTDQDFFGVRRGDANNTWPSLFIESDDVQEITGSMTIAEAVVGPGGIATVELRAEGLMDLGVVEYHIAFDPSVVTLQHIETPDLGGAVTLTSDSTISVSWFNISSPINCDDRILGLFTFEAVNEVNVQSDIELTSVVLGDANGVELFTEQNDGSIMVSNINGVNYQGAELVTEWALRPSYPNPFNAYTTLSFDVKDAAEVQIHVYNVLGDLVTTLVQGNLPKGRYTKSVNANSWSSGTYFIVMKTQSFNKVQKIVLLK